MLRFAIYYYTTNRFVLHYTFLRNVSNNMHSMSLSSANVYNIFSIKQRLALSKTARICYDITNRWRDAAWGFAGQPCSAGIDLLCRMLLALILMKNCEGMPCVLKALSICSHIGPKPRRIRRRCALRKTGDTAFGRTGSLNGRSPAVPKNCVRRGGAASDCSPTEAANAW